MNHRLLWATALIVSAVLPATAATATLKLSSAQIAASGIRVQPVRASAGGDSLPFSARVMAAPDAEWVVTAPLGGVVTRLLVAEGERVRPGQPLLQLRAPEAPGLAAEWRQAEGAARLAQAERDRDRALHADGIIAARRLQASEQQALAAGAQREAAAARLRLLGISAAEAGSGDISLRAPAGALVIARMAALGQRVNEADALLRLADPARLNLELQVPVALAGDFRIGQWLTTSDKPVVKARVTQVGWGSANDSQSVLVRATLPTGISTELRPGQWLQVSRRGVASQTAAGWQVPEAALLHHGGGVLVLVQRQDGFAPVPVTALGRRDGWAVVSGPLAAGDQVAVSGLITLKGLLAGGE